MLKDLCIYLDEGKGVALMHVYALGHIIGLSYRTTLWIFTKLDRDEGTHLCIGFSANSTQGRIQGGAICKKQVNEVFLLQRTSFSDLKATTTN